MILLNEVATKLQKIFNGVDAEIVNKGIESPTDFYFAIETTGFHIDHIKNNQLGKNFIPVFIDSMGGDYNAVPALKQATVSIPVVIYFPVRFKEQMFALNDFLAECFVGQFLTYGTKTGKCISNISVAQYGEIQQLDLKQFATWVENKYQKTIDNMEPYMTMQFNLYLTNASQKYLYGNAVSYQLSITIDGKTYTDDKLVWASSGTGYSNSPVAQQLIGVDNYAKNVSNISNYSKSILVYPDFTKEMWQKFLTAYNNRETNLIESLTLTKIYDFGESNQSFAQTQLILSINENIALGDLISYTITLGDSL